MTRRFLAAVVLAVLAVTPASAQTKRSFKPHAVKLRELDGVAVQTLNPGDDVQKALDACPEGGAVRLNPGTKGTGIYSVDKPLRLYRSHVLLEGASTTYGVQIKTGKSFYGPIIFGAPEGMSPTLGPSLATGPGQSYTLEEGTNYWLNLRDALDVDGLTQFCVECFFKPSMAGYPADQRYLLSSSGSLASGFPIDTAFSLGHYSTGVSARLKTTGGSIGLSGPPLVPGQTYHLALTYDGVMARLFVDGTLTGLIPLTGTVVQAPWEDVVVGPRCFSWPESVFNEYSTAGQLDGLRFSKVARYLVNFNKPTTKPALDASTLLLLNFDQIDGLLIVGDCGNGLKAYLPWHTDQSSVELSGIRVQNLWVVGGEAVAGKFNNCKSSTFRNLSCYFCKAGWEWYGNCYDCNFDRIEALGSGPRDRFGIHIGHAAFDQHCGRLETFGFAVGVVLQGFAGRIDYATTYLGQSSKFGLLVKRCTDGPVTFGTWGCSDEPSPPPDNLIAACCIEGTTAATFNGFSPQVARSARPMLRLYGGGCLTLANPMPRINVDTPCIVDVVSPPTMTPVRVGGIQTGGNCPWGM